MTTTVSTPTTPAALQPGRTETRVAAAAAALLGVSLFMTVAVMNVPRDLSDAALVTWWGDSGNRLTGVVSGVFALLVAVSLPVVVNHLLSRREVAASPEWASFARSMAAAVSAVWLVTGALRGAIGHLVDTMGEPLPEAGVLRFSTAANYMLLGQLGMAVLALCIFATSMLVLRTGVLASWAGYVGMGCSVVTTAAVAAQYGAFTTPLAILWALCLSVAIARRRHPAAV